MAPPPRPRPPPPHQPPRNPSASSASSPRVIGCGHLVIVSKSANEFPAFLVRLPTRRRTDGDGELCDDGGRLCYWRTKRDFLLLNRSLRRSADPTRAPPPSPPFPKSALSKLSERAAEGPWARPDDDDAPPGGYRRLADRLSRGEGRSSDGAGLERDGFEARMTKCLVQMDDFLNAAAARAAEDGSDGPSSGTRLAWSVFCRREDSEGLTAPSGPSRGDEPGGTRSRSLPSPAALGQYFASDENAREVARTALEMACKTNPGRGRLVFLEPSCGDGRIIRELIQELLRSKTVLESNLSIVGIDIDPLSVERAKQNLQSHRILLKCGDFLSMERKKLLSDSPASEGPEKLILLGGPPYTPKRLPELFIMHSILGLKADGAVFILPERCVSDAERIQNTLNRHRDRGKGRWEYDNRNLDNVIFHFEGKAVSQPSILQSWHRVP